MKPFTTILLSLLCSIPATAGVYTVTSPNNALKITVSTDRQLTWSIDKGTINVLKPSAISVTTDRETLGKDIQKCSGKTSALNQGQRTCHQFVLSCKGYDVEFRAFDDAAAYRILPKKTLATVKSETSEYNFSDDHKVFVPYVNDNRGGERWCYSFESYYDECPISQMYKDSLSITPLAVCLPQGKKAVVMEADVENYPGMYLVKGNGNSLQATFPPYPIEENTGGFNRLNIVPIKRADYIAKNVAKTPWRIVLVTDEDKELIGNTIANTLNPKPRIADTSWIKPGKVAWDWWNNRNISGVDFRAGINTETYKYFIDFAKANHIEDIIIDEGWSDPEDLLVFTDQMDMPGIIRHAKEEGVGVILWSSWRNLIQRGSKKMDDIMKHYADMGVKGFKVDFFDRDDQKAVNSVYEIAACAARHHLLLDLHGMRPFGVQTAYPNIINFEGVKGLENSKWEPRTATGPLHDQPRYDVTIPFLRMLPGPMDYTPGAMANATRDQFFGNNDHPMSQGTRVHQMAMYTIYDAPLQMLADSPTQYLKNQECTDFMVQIPTLFDEVIPLSGELGEYVAVAKRKGATWYIAAMTNWQARDLTLDLSYLKGLNATADIFADGINADREATDYRHTRLQVKTGDKLNIHLAPGGGWTAILKPIR